MSGDDALHGLHPPIAFSFNIQLLQHYGRNALATTFLAHILQSTMKALLNQVAEQLSAAV
jgi:hypothetical protein